MEHFMKVIGNGVMLMVRDFFKMKQEMSMRGIFTCQWLMEMESTQTLKGQSMMANGNLISSMDMEKKNSQMALFTRETSLKG